MLFFCLFVYQAFILYCIGHFFSLPEVSLNPDGKPKRGSFEVVLSKGEEEVVLWSGLTKGPPRRLKFPATDEIVKLTEEHV